MCQVKYEKNVALNALVQMSEDSTRNKIRRIEGLIEGLTVSQDLIEFKSVFLFK